MSEKIEITVDRPNVGIFYRGQTSEALLQDRLAASELALHALAQSVRDIRAYLALPCPVVVKDLADSDSWILGFQ